jgi:peptide/nickel transport system substrate-binding protein
MGDRQVGAAVTRRSKLATSTRRSFLVRAGALAMASPLLTSCSPSDVVPSQSASVAASARPVVGGTVVEGAPVDIEMLNPILGRDNYGFGLAQMMFDGLVSSDMNGNLFPLIAEAMPSVSPDNLTLTFKLRPNIKWTDGRALTAEDVAFSFQLFHDPKYKEVNTTRRAEFEQYVESVLSPDPMTVVFKMKSVYAPLLSSSLQRGILPKHILGALPARDLNTAAFNAGSSVTNGAFRFVRWDKGQQVVLERNPTYWRGPARLERYVLRVIPDSSAMVSALRTGEIDLVIGLDPVLAEQVRNSQLTTVAEYWTTTQIRVTYQLDPTKRAYRILSEKAVRHALFYALDREKMAQAIYRGAARPAHSIIPADSWAYNANVSPKYGFDVGKANNLLDGAGWRRGPDGVRAKEGTRLELEITSLAGQKPIESTVQSVQEQWRTIGVATTVKLTDMPTLTQELRTRREFDVIISGRNLAQDPDPSFQVSTRDAGPGGLNSAHYTNPRVDKMLEDGVATFDQDARKKIYHELQDLVMDDLPYATIFEIKDLIGLNKRVEGIAGVVGAHNRFFRSFGKDVWVRDGK